ARAPPARGQRSLAGRCLRTAGTAVAPPASAPPQRCHGRVARAVPCQSAGFLIWRRRLEPEAHPGHQERPGLVAVPEAGAGPGPIGRPLDQLAADGVGVDVGDDLEGGEFVADVFVEAAAGLPEAEDLLVALLDRQAPQPLFVARLYQICL